MQINFEPEKIKAAKAYVDRLTPVKIQTKEKVNLNIKNIENNNIAINKDFYTTEKEETPSFIKTVLNFLFK